MSGGPAMEGRAAALIRDLELQPHPEGGHYREVFRSARRVRPVDAGPERAALTSIYYLLPAGAHSRWHRVASDEAWHFHEGDPLELFWIDTDDSIHREVLGPAGAGHRPIHVVPAGCWQAARPTGAFALVGCTVGPGFDFADFEMLPPGTPGGDALRSRPDLPPGLD